MRWILATFVMTACTTGGAHFDDSRVAPSSSTDGGFFALARFELCNNGIDDDQNGAIDDGCVCAIGARQSCYPGWPASAGVGACTLGVSTCEPAESIGRWRACEGAVLPGLEQCGDGIDGDCDGQIDEHCPCAEGATQRCFGAASSALGVGVCRAGTHVCERQPGLDDTWFLGWGECVGAIHPSGELCNGLDDDCNGAADDLGELCNLIDDDCDGHVDEGDACGALPESWALTRYWPATGSGVLDGRVPLYARIAVAPSEECDGVRIVDDSGETPRCVGPPPSDCPPGTQPEWADGGWACVPCEVLVQFGHIYGFERTCAPEPSLPCGPGNVPTYSFEMRRWECLPECDNTLYDRAFRDGRLVCVPC